MLNSSLLSARANRRIHARAGSKTAVRNEGMVEIGYTFNSLAASQQGEDAMKAPSLASCPDALEVQVQSQLDGSIGDCS